MSRFLKSPRRLAPNQPRGYFYQPLRAPRAHPLSVALRGHVVFPEIHTHSDTAAHTLKYVKCSTHVEAHVDTHIATGKTVVTHSHCVAALFGGFVWWFKVLSDEY